MNCDHEHTKQIQETVLDYGDGTNMTDTAYICLDCGLFVVHRTFLGKPTFHYEFRLGTPEQAIAAADPVLARTGLRIMSADVADRETARVQAEEETYQRILRADKLRDSTGKALDDYLRSKRE